MKGKQFELDLHPETKKTKTPDVPDDYLYLFDQPRSYLTSEIARIEARIRECSRYSDTSDVSELEEHLKILNRILQYKNTQEAAGNP